MPGFPILHTISWRLLKLIFIELVIPSNHLILCRPLLLPPSIFPSIRVFSNESILHIRWLKYWSFSFSISPSSEYLGLISFRTCRSAAPKFPIERESQSHKSVCINVLNVIIHKATGEERCHVLHNIKSFEVDSGG